MFDTADEIKQQQLLVVYYYPIISTGEVLHTPCQAFSRAA